MINKGLMALAMVSLLVGCGGGGGGAGSVPVTVSVPVPDPVPDPIPDPIPDPVPDPESESSGPVTFLLNGAVSVVTTDNTAVQTASGKNLEGSSKSGNLNSFTFIDADNAQDFKKQKSAVLSPLSKSNNKSANITTKEGESSEESSASNLFVIDENGAMSFGAVSEYDFKVSYSVVKNLANEAGEIEQFVYFAITNKDDDFWLSQQFIMATGDCAIFKVATADGKWTCVAANVLPIAMDDSYRQTMSDDTRKPLQVDDQGNVFVLASNINSIDDNDDGITDWIDLDWSVQPTIRKISPTGEVKEITRDDIYVQSYIKIDNDSLVYSYIGNNTGLNMIVGLSQETQSSVELGRQGYWNNFFYAIDDHNTIIFSQNGGQNNSGISFGQKSETYVGGAETFNLNTKPFSNNNGNSTPRRVVLADDGSIYGLFEDSVWDEASQTYQSFANLKRILPYSSATYARFNVGSSWWAYFDNGQRNVQLSKGYAFYLEDESHSGYGKRTNIKAVRMVDGALTTMLDGEWASERYEISTWKLSGDTIYFSGFDSANSQMIAGQVDTSKMKQGLSQQEFLTITAAASIMGENNNIDDYEVLHASDTDNPAVGNPRILQVYTDPENIYSASVEFNKVMNAGSVSAFTSVSYQNEFDEAIDVVSMKVWLGRSLHLIFDTNYVADDDGKTDPLPYDTQFNIAVDGAALDSQGIQLLVSETPLISSFTTRPETGFYASSAEVIDGVTDGTVLRYSAAQNRSGIQAVANLATDIKTINHQVEFSTPASLEGRFILKLADPYQVNWNDVTNKIVDSADNAKWQSFDGFKVDVNNNVHRQFQENNAPIDAKWERILNSLTVTPTTTSNVDEEIFLDIVNAKTYQEVPRHLVSLNGEQFSETWDNLRETYTRKNVNTGVSYLSQEPYQLDRTTGVEYRWSFSAWRDSEGNELPDDADVLYVSQKWVDELNGEEFTQALEWVSQSWVNIADSADVLVMASTVWVNNYYGSDLNGDSKIDLSGLAAFGGREAATEVTHEWRDTWEWQADFVAGNFEATTDDYRWFSTTEFGGYGLNSSQSYFNLVGLDSNYTNYFNQDWANSVSESLTTRSSWLKHTMQYTTNADTGEITYSYVVTDTQGEEVYSTTQALFVDVVDASWSYLLATESQGGFALRLSIEQNGSVAIDNLKVTDLTDLANPETGGVIFSSEFTNGNEGVFVKVQ